MRPVGWVESHETVAAVVVLDSAGVAAVAAAVTGIVAASAYRTPLDCHRKDHDFAMPGLADSLVADRIGSRRGRFRAGGTSAG